MIRPVSILPGMSTTERASQKSVVVNHVTGEMVVTMPDLLVVGEVCTVSVQKDWRIDVTSGSSTVGDREDKAIATEHALQAIRTAFLCGAIRCAEGA